ncbi:hypothetical protein, partial [Pseudocolwellia agarivorans]|uniref:hypothetical protein n=1 Tax=Pseudocolwellia agarivorans TaxID=1911682 RepID=UPI001FEA476D
ALYFQGGMGLRIVLLLYFVSFFSSAMSCHITDKQFEKWNHQYSHLFQIKKTNSVNGYSVITSFPKTISGLNFQNAGIFKDSLKNPTFYTSLQPINENGILKVWFTGIVKSKEHYFLSFSYGQDCGISVSLPVELN